MRHLLIKETADGRERRSLDFSWKEAAVNADNLFTKLDMATFPELMTPEPIVVLCGNSLRSVPWT